MGRREMGNDREKSWEAGEATWERFRRRRQAVGARCENSSENRRTSEAGLEKDGNEGAVWGSGEGLGGARGSLGERPEERWVPQPRGLLRVRGM